MVPRYYESGLDAKAKGLHNLFFEIATGCGLPATFFYFAFLLIPCFESARRLIKYRREHIDFRLHAGMFTAACGIPGFIVSNMFSAGALIEGSYILAVIGGASVLVHQASLTRIRASDGQASIPDAEGSEEPNSKMTHAF
jgi:O-antigen ligase